MKTPKYIAVDGGEGSGKSTLIKTLPDIFGELVFTTREPGGSPDGKVIRRVLLNHPFSPMAGAEAELHLMFVDRYDHVKEVVKPKVDAGICVVTDRSDASSWAYQVNAGSNIATRGILEAKFWEYRKGLVLVPLLYVVLDVDPEVGLSRRKATNRVNHIDTRPIEFHQMVRRALLEFPNYIQSRSVIIDANRPLEDVKKDFLAVIRREIGGFS
ncbi:dTMP kinase [Patescibacteria group bacterium]|nr:dTMP kinase [Patescibacteria group bacterium]MDE1946420.1 dTMP kinase [Patescibacteria group bacterium]MDE2011029.1 dTMP kinase [Patescibacteria group bacterium]MDE2233474.1 dTMP kinase [Patescibacteria group bacterium]